MSELYIDYSTLSAWRLCPQKFRYEYQLNLARGSTEALDFGTLMHFGCELLGKAGDDVSATPTQIEEEIAYLTSGEPPDPNRTDNTLLKVLHFTAIEGSAFPLARLANDERRSLKHALTLVARYAMHYQNDPLRYTTFEAFHQAYLGETPKGNNVFYRGTVDGLTADAVIERKTTSYINSGFLNRINPNDQATGYLFLGRDLTGNASLSKIVFDAISTSGYGRSWEAKTSQPDRWTINTNPEKLFLRTETTRSEDQIADWRRRVLSDADRLLEDYVADSVSANAPDACTMFNTTCSFIQLCQSSSAIRKTLEANTLRKTERWKGFEVKE